MNNLIEVFEESKKRMYFKDLDFFNKLDEKQIRTMFYPGLILAFAEYTNYSWEDAKELALLSQLLSYSIEIHEKIFQEEKIVDLVVLEGDHLYISVFKEITTSNHIKDIGKFTDYIRTFSEKRIMCIDGILTEEEVNEYKFKHITKIITEIVAAGDTEIKKISEKLSDIFIIYLKDESKFEEAKEKFIIEIAKEYNPKILRATKYIIESMGGVNIEK